MPWIKTGEDYYSTNRKTRDRKGGHSPSILFDKSGVAYVTPTQKRTQKRKKSKIHRCFHKKDISTRIEEMIADIESAAQEMRDLEMEDLAWYDDSPMECDPFHPEDDDLAYDAGFYNPWGDYDYYHRFSGDYY